MIKFYEFNKHPYYALISANTAEESIEFYNEFVCDLQEDKDDIYGDPDEITKEQVDAKLQSCKDNRYNEETEMMFEQWRNIGKATEPDLWLIDGSLV